MKKRILVITALILILLMTTVYGATDVTMEIVENNICTIDLDENAKFEKKIIDSNTSKKQVTLQLEVSNNSKAIIPAGELILVIDNSSSMNDSVSGTTATRKDLVLNSAQRLVNRLLNANSSTLQIGVVAFSSSTEASEMGTENDAQIISNLTNNEEDLVNKISSIESTGNYTDLDAGLNLAASLYSESAQNKYMIVLTDGLPNMNLGNSDLLSHDALTTVINTTKNDLLILGKNDVSVICMLTGISDENAIIRDTGENSYTYKDVIEGIFGTEEKPTAGKFYNISDAEIEETIKEEIYSDLVPASSTLTDLVIYDYFPQYIVNNFEMAYVDGIDSSNVSTILDKDTNGLTFKWNIDSLKEGESAKIQYTITLKDEFNEEIIDDILNTNLKVDITYNDFDGNAQSKSSDVSPKIKLTAIEDVPKTEETNKTEETVKTEETAKTDELIIQTQSTSTTKTTNTAKTDTTKAQEQTLPKTGAPIIIGFIIALFVATGFFAIRYSKSNF